MSIYLSDGRQQQQQQPSSHHQSGWFIGSVGVIPVKSNQWFLSPDEVAAVRQKARSICAGEEPVTDDDDGDGTLRLLVYQRDSSR